ncbi:hypothetical protein IAU60_000469 [Kwoniella sp. DSM 27419]
MSPATPQNGTKPTIDMKRSRSRSSSAEYRPKADETTPKKRGRPAGQKNNPGGDRKMGAWTKKEVRELWNALGLLPVKVKWDDVAERVEGRDKLSCSNKWRYDIQPKLQAFIDSLGE